MAKQITYIGQLVAVLLAILAALVATPGMARAQGAALDMSYSDVVLVIDNSGSMRQNDPNYLRLAAAKLFVDLSDPRDQIGIVVLSDDKQTRKLTRRMIRATEREDIDNLKQQIESIRTEPMGEETHMGTALTMAYELLDTTPASTRGANKNQFVVMLSDGRPTGSGQADQTAQAAQRFKERRYWKVFSIALGPEADPNYLRTTVADPTGAEVVVAKDASQLIDSYIDVYGRVGDDRFIDRVTVEPNGLVPLIDVQPDQQPTQLSVVLVRPSPDTHISSLVAPEDRDVVRPYYQNTVRRGTAPEYDLYTVPPEAQVALAGHWTINIDKAEGGKQQVVVLSRSKLRMRLQVPPPLDSDDDSSLRYQPVGRPLLLVAGAQVARRDLDGTADQPFRYDWVSGMTPVVHQIAPQAGDTTPLVDDGREADIQKSDGRYTGTLPTFPSEGDYTVRVEMPRHLPGAIGVGKSYLIRVASLPTMTLSLPPAATTLPINTNFAGLVDLPGRADFKVEQVTFLSAFVKRPDGVLDALDLRDDGEARYQFHYTPAFAGAYAIDIVAEVRGTGPMGPIRYVDYASAPIAVPEAVPTVAVQTVITQTLRYNGDGVVGVPLRISSQSPQQEPLDLSVEGMPGSTVLPKQLLIEPHESGQRTVAVRLPPGNLPKQGELTLIVTSPGQRALVQGSKNTVPFRAPGNLLLPIAIAVLAVTVVGWVFYRRHNRRQRVQTMLAASAFRRVP